MKQKISVEACLERAQRLRLLADQATNYDLMLTYDQLAEEWIHLASKASRAAGKRAVAPRLGDAAPRRGLHAWLR